MNTIELSKEQYDFLKNMFSENNDNGKAVINLPDELTIEYEYGDIDLFRKISKNILTSDGNYIAKFTADDIYFIVDWLHYIETELVVNNERELSSIENSKALTFTCELIDYIEQFVPVEV